MVLERILNTQFRTVGRIITWCGAGARLGGYDTLRLHSCCEANHRPSWASFGYTCRHTVDTKMLHLLPIDPVDLCEMHCACQ